MVTLEPVMGMMMNLIPLKQSYVFLDYFLLNGWKFFYSLFLTFLDEISVELMNDDCSTDDVM